MTTHPPRTAAPALDLDLDKLLAARLLAVRARPYLATALFALHPVASRDVPTMAVDRYWRCYVSPVYVAATPLEELAGVWVHEVSHLLRDHHGRGDRVARSADSTGRGSGCGRTSPPTARSTTTCTETDCHGPTTSSCPRRWGWSPGC